MATKQNMKPTSLFTDGTRRQKTKRKVSLREAKIRTVGICGVGLIGGSIAECLRKSSRSLKIVGYDKSNIVALAKKQKLIDSSLKPAEMLDACDLIVLSANPATNQTFLKQINKQDRKQVTGARTLILDTGSTQSEIASLGQAMSWSADVAFIAGHPMAGREVQGINNRLADLFAGHPFFFDESVKLSATQKLKIDWFTQVLGAFPLYVNNLRHDTVMTDISHIPQLLSTVISGFVNHYDKQTIHLAGTGLKSMIRLGGSPYSNWSDVFSDNRTQICERLDSLIDELKTVRNKIDAGESLTKSFQKAKRSYSCLW